jgi:hypothetical protein
MASALAIIGAIVLAFRHRSTALASVALLALLALVAASARKAPPALLWRAAALWRPVGDAVGTGLSFLALNAVYWTVLGPISLVRRARRETLSMPQSQAECPSYWQETEASRGAPDRMY